LRLEIEILQNGIAIGPGGVPGYTATTQYYDYNDGNNDNGVVLLLRFFNDGGHLLVHDCFSFE